MNARILMFGWEFPPHNSGGLGTACLGLTRALSNHNVDITFVLPKKMDVSSDECTFVFADVGTKPMKVISHNSLLYPYITESQYDSIFAEQKISAYGKSLWEEVQMYGLRARQIAENEQFDIIHAHDWLSFVAGMEAKHVSGKPLVVHVHATEFDRTGGRGVNQLVYDIERAGMEQADEVLAVSQYTKDIIVNHYGINPDKVHVVHNGIDLQDHYIAPDEDPQDQILALKEMGFKIVLYVGRITMQKGPDYFIKAAKKVLEHSSNVIFIIAGSGDMERQIIDEAVSLGISDKIFFTGFLRGKELSKIYKSADLYVMPSISEPFGITPLEAMAHGTPVMVSKQSGVSEVLAHALKVDFWDIDEMANQILASLRYDALSQTLQENGRREVSTITWDKAADKCISSYSRLLRISP
jgi:glycosyltransferase involved in cell wall biosynthesis